MRLTVNSRFVLLHRNTLPAADRLDWLRLAILPPEPLLLLRLMPHFTRNPAACPRGDLDTATATIVLFLPRRNSAVDANDDVVHNPIPTIFTEYLSFPIVSGFFSREIDFTNVIAASEKRTVQTADSGQSRKKDRVR